MMSNDVPAASTARTGQLVEFLRQNLFRVKLSNGVPIIAVMPDELLPSFDPNMQLSKYNYPHVVVDMREPPQLPKIIEIHRSSWCGLIPRKFYEYEE
jgi:hypothetical protein